MGWMLNFKNVLNNIFLILFFILFFVGSAHAVERRTDVQPQITIGRIEFLGVTQFQTREIEAL